MSRVLNTFIKFLASDNSCDMYISGPAGTGKTYSTAEIVQYCIDNHISYVVCAFTHDACAVLASKLPKGANIQTLHKFLRKRPTVNTDAIHKRHVTMNAKFGDSEEYEVCIIDEFSQVGERDSMDLREMQDIEEEWDENDNLLPSDKKPLRLVWVGDQHQLPPVGDQQAIEPHGKYWVQLNKQYRLIEGNPLAKPISQLISFIEGEDATPLETSEFFQRGKDIIDLYKRCEDHKIILAFTNKKVQELNSIIEGKILPEPGDKLFSPTTRDTYTFIREVPSWGVYCIDRAFGDPLELYSKYKTLEFLVEEGYTFCEVEDIFGNTYIFAYVFGHNSFKLQAEKLKQAAAGINKKILDETGLKASEWAAKNEGTALFRNRSLAWRKFLSFNQNVICLDFAHAKTIHKSQGMTVHTVFLDSEDLNIAADINYMVYLKLNYVALSRATTYVYTN